MKKDLKKATIGLMISIFLFVIGLIAINIWNIINILTVILLFAGTLAAVIFLDVILLIMFLYNKKSKNYIIGSSSQK